VAGNQMRVDIDGNLCKPKSVADDQFKLIKPQNVSMYTAHNSEFKVSKKLLNNNWVTEKWILSEEIIQEGSIPSKKIKTTTKAEDFLRSGKINLAFEKSESKKLKTNIQAEDFLKSGKINLIWEKFKIIAPVFIHWEFDNWQPWFIEETDNVWKSNFMLPTGTWRFFFTSNLSTSFISNDHRR